MNNSLLTNYKSPYLGSLASDFDRKTKSRESFVLPEPKENNIADISLKQSDNLQKKGKKVNWGYLSGVAATAAQIVAGACMLGSAFLEKKGKVPINLIKNINHLGWVSLGFSYLVSIPSLVGASLAVKQPSMLLGAALWAAASPFMMMKKFNDSARLKGFLMLGYSLTYLGLANKIKNDKNLNKSEKLTEFDFKEKKNNLLKKTSDIIKFSLKDHLSLPESVKNAFKQTKEYISRKRKEIPDFISMVLIVGSISAAVIPLFSKLF